MEDTRGRRDPHHPGRGDVHDSPDDRERRHLLRDRRPGPRRASGAERGKLIINDESDATNFRLVLGGNSTSGTGGSFEALISGPGSEMTLTGKDAQFVLGRAPGGTGTLRIDNGATVNADIFQVGRDADTDTT